MANLIDEVGQYLDAQGVGTLADTLFLAYLPEDTTDTFDITVLNTGGTTPDAYLPTNEPTFQVYIRANDYETGLAKLNAVRQALHRQANVQLVTSGIYFYFILAISEGGHLGRDEQGRDLFSINFRARTR